MSSDNYYLIRNHPNGGFAVVMGFSSDSNAPSATEDSKQFETIDDAADSVANEYSEYGIRIHSECVEEYKTNEEALIEATKLLKESNAELVRMYATLDDIYAYAIQLKDTKGADYDDIGDTLLQIIQS